MAYGRRARGSARGGGEDGARDDRQAAVISWMALAFMTTGSVASLRSSPTMAVYGLACVFLYVVPAIVFLMPQALVAAELASGWSGGVYRWVRRACRDPGACSRSGASSR